MQRFLYVVSKGSHFFQSHTNLLSRTFTELHRIAFGSFADGRRPFAYDSGNMNSLPAENTRRISI